MFCWRDMETKRGGRASSSSSARFFSLTNNIKRIKMAGFLSSLQLESIDKMMHSVVAKRRDGGSCFSLEFDLLELHWGSRSQPSHQVAKCYWREPSESFDRCKISWTRVPVSSLDLDDHQGDLLKSVAFPNPLLTRICVYACSYQSKQDLVHIFTSTVSSS